MMPEIKKQAPQCAEQRRGPITEADTENINQQSEKSKPSAIAYFVIDKMSGYVAGGMKPETSAHYTREEMLAIYKGNHRSRDTSGTFCTTPPPEALGIEAAMAKCDVALAEILKYCTEAVKAKKPETHEAPEKPLQPTEPSKRYEGTAALAEYAKRGIKLMPCVPVEDDPKRYRPIVKQEKWPDVATSDMETIKAYQSGAKWPNEKIHLLRFIPEDAEDVCIDVDNGHADGTDGEANLYRLLRARGYDPLPPLLRDLRNFPVRVETPSGGVHLYFSYNGPEIKKRKLAEGVEVFHTNPLTAAGSRKENKAYILHGDIGKAPPLPAELLAIINDTGQPHQAPDAPPRRTENNVRGDNGKAALKGRLREYIAARGIAVTKKGGLEWMRCPLHDDDSPSMQINASGKYAGILKCHACGASLDVFGLTRITAGLPEGRKYFPQAVQEVKAALGMGQ
jgi:hypothetical protein